MSPNSAGRQIVLSTLRTFEEGFDNGPTTHFDHLDPEDFMRRVRLRMPSASSCNQMHVGLCLLRHESRSAAPQSKLRPGGAQCSMRPVATASRSLPITADRSMCSRLEPSGVGGNECGRNTSLVWKAIPWCCHHSPYGDYAKKMYAEYSRNSTSMGCLSTGRRGPAGLEIAFVTASGAKQNIRGRPVSRSGSRRMIRSFIAAVRSGSRNALSNILTRFTHWFAAAARACRSGSNQCDPLDMATEVLRKSSCLYLEPLASPSGLSTSSILLRGWKTRGPQVGLFWGGYTMTRWRWICIAPPGS